MSAQENTAPASGSSGFGIWTWLRIAGIVVGVATLLRLATNEGMVTYDPLFLAWMDWLSDIVELGFLTKLIGPFLHWVIEWVRSLGISVPDLQDEWRPAFVLSMLMGGAFARHSRGLWLFLAAPLGALAIAVWSGLIGSLAPVAVAVVAVAAFAAFIWTRVATGGLRANLAAYLIAIGFSVVVGFASNVAFAASSVVAVAVAAVAAVFLFSGIVWGSSGGWRAVLANASFNMGIDILGVMLGALGIASLFASPPIW